MLDTVRVRPHGLVRGLRMRRVGGPLTVVIDVDGTLTDGGIYLDRQGIKTLKRFGADDADGIKALKAMDINVQLVTADRRGLEVSEWRAKQLDVWLTVKSESQRSPWLRAVYNPARTCYVGDGYYDATSFAAVGFGIAVAGSLPHTRRAADAVTSRRGGDRAVAQAARFILKYLVTDRLKEEK